VGFDDEVEIRGSYAEQPAYVKAASWLAYLSCVDLLVFVPISVGAAIIGGVGTPASSESGKYLPFIILFGMLSIGGWMNHMWLGWLPGKQRSQAWRWLVFVTHCAVSAAASAALISANIWPRAFLWALAFVPIGLISLYLAAKIKQFARGAT
jgi:hypothetical protein